MDPLESTIMTLRPTWEEFKDFSNYIESIERMGGHKAGAVKVSICSEPHI